MKPNSELIEQELFEQFSDYAVIQGIRKGDIDRTSIKKNSLEDYVSKDLNPEIRSSGRMFHISDEGSINNYLIQMGSQKRYFYFPDSEGFVYGEAIEYSNGIVVVNPECETTNLTKNCWGSFRKGNKFYINKRTIDSTFDIMVELYNPSNKLGKALSLVGINSKEELRKSEEAIKYTHFLKIFADNEKANPIMKFIEYLEQKRN